MRVLLVAEKEGTAIHRLCVQMQKYATWHEFRIVCVHPKRPTIEQMQEFINGVEWCDVIDFQYWRTAEMLMDKFEPKKPAMLSHHNPYDLTRAGWTRYKFNVVSNAEQARGLRMPSERIELPVDLDYWTFDVDQEKKYDVILVQNRIEAKKGALPVAEACKKGGYKMALVGDISDPEYYEKIIATGVVDFFHRISDEELRDLYHASRIHICNSIDKFESGTLPILEAMACGTPVITRRIGHVPDLFNGRNMVVRRGEVEDIDEIIACINEILTNDIFRKEMILEARHSLRYRNYEIYARKYSILYHRLLQEKELVSVIIPTIAEPEKLKNTLAHVMAQSYGPMEIVIVDDSEDPSKNKALVEALRGQTPHTLKFYTSATYFIDENGEPRKTYGLAAARNKAIMEAEGKWLWFVDDRMLPAPDSLMHFYDRRKEFVWLWGKKDGVSKAFVENFSFCRREDLVRIGMFNQQITQYGGMTQEVRTRWEGNKYRVEFVDNAEAKTQAKSSSRWKRTSDIAKSKTQCYKLYG